MNHRHILPFAALVLVHAHAQSTVPPAPVPEPAAVPPVQAASPSGTEARDDATVRRTIRTINYRLVKGSTRIGFQADPRHPEASGSAKIKTRDGITLIKARFDHLPEPSAIGAGNLTYVLWAVTPEGQAANLGELQVNGGKARIKAAEQLPAFGLIVTAEPHFAVARPSDAVVLENAVGKDAREPLEVAEARLPMMSQAWYRHCIASVHTPVVDSIDPVEVQQACQAVRIAESVEAAKYAGDAMARAEAYLGQAMSREAGKKDRIMTARSATASAEEARLLAMRGREAEREDRERLRAQARLDQARQEAAKAATAKEEALKQAHRTAQENEGLRTRLMAELSGILQTRATAQGLIVSMSGVLFKTGQSTLLPEAREKLAKVAGVLATRQGIRIKAEGFTDSTGTPGLNDRLSRERAEAARDFLVSQGVPADAVTFEGFGQAHPVADNATQAGRQENRRVELVVSGEGLEEQPAPEPGQH